MTISRCKGPSEAPLPPERNPAAACLRTSPCDALKQNRATSRISKPPF
ncbi:hypothetical protein [Paracoccus rhizosphaerae]|uniref:Uncharacterized protein n=1 Tax=Paracoccus rhizosphaerae TaxID=1133347 RepID=A0ABV6CH02_9RHOB|nr:hypothetical protein [Paracoccus rhizosphaerae]